VSPPGEALLRAAGGHRVRCWTHSPADQRRSRGRLGQAVARAAAERGIPVTHAVGHSPYLQVVSDRDVPLSAALTGTKIGFANRFCGALLHADSAEYTVDTARVPAAERFFRSSPGERDRLFALLGSLGEEAATVVDPWEFATSPYEGERLDATSAWIAGHLDPDDGALLELGACEGALTRRLAEKGFRVHAAEPNDRFHARLAGTVGGTGDRVTVHRLGLEEVAAGRGPRGSAAHLLVEMLYYGQRTELLDRLPGELLFVALAPESLDAVLRPWLERSPRWRAEEQVLLVAPRVESVCGGRAYLSKRGSTGLLLRRT
ncbi:hypothetical protein, partial [Streptomyces sparsus]